MKGKLLFHESQAFRGTFFWWLQTIISLVIIGGLSVKLAISWLSDESISTDQEQWIALGITAVILSLIFWLFSVIKLDTEIDHDGIYYRYIPFVNSKKQLTKSDLAHVEVRRYNPILEYGGWGYRVSLRNGKAYNVKGKWGLQLIIKNGKKLLLGTQKPTELEAAINTLKANWRME